MPYSRSGMRMQFNRPTTNYDEKIKQVDEQLCDLIRQRKEISNNDPGYPPFDYIEDWAEKYDLYEDLLKSIFSTLWHDEIYRPVVDPENYIKTLPVLRSIEVDEKLFSVISMRQYENASILNFNIDWDCTSDKSEGRFQHTMYELSINDKYDCRTLGGSGSDGHQHNNFLVSPPLPDDFSGSELTFKQYDYTPEGKQVGQDVVLRL